MEQKPQGSDGSYFIADTIWALVHDSYEASEEYGRITKKLADTDEVHRHLTNSDGDPTEGDTALVKLLHEYEQYLKTSTARYYVAAERLAAAANRYEETEALNKHEIDRVHDIGDVQDDHHDYAGDGKAGSGAGRAGSEAEGTNRPPGSNEKESAKWRTARG